jgi:hypothetical protein
MQYMHIKFNCLAHTTSHKSNKYLLHQVIQQYELAGGGRGLGPPIEDYFLHVRTSLELWPSLDFGVTIITFR